MTLGRERALESRMLRELNRTAALAAANVQAGHDADSDMRQHEVQVRAILRASYSELMPAAGKNILDAAGKAAKPSVFESLVLSWIEEAAARKVQAISATTRRQLRESIASARAEGLGTGGVAKRIRDDLGGTIARARSHVIARTETHQAANAAQHFAAESLGRDDMKREWVSAEDERTRDDHAAANGQVVGLEQPFTVGGVSLMYPGDMGGPPEQVINCRCTTGYIVS